MKFEDIPTPETDAELRRKYDLGCTQPSLNDLCRAFERRLAVARDALQAALNSAKEHQLLATVCRNKSQNTFALNSINAITEALAQTAPKP